MTRSRTLPESQAGACCKTAALFRHPKQTAVGILAVAGLVALGIWIWPELHRTIRIHRM